jgi:Tol biopolymer transport system component
LFAVPFDADRLAPAGQASRVADDIRRASQDSRFNTAAANYGVSDDGTLMYVPGGGTAADTRNTTLAIVDSTGARTPVEVLPNRYVAPRVSVDGQTIAVEAEGEDASDIWIYPVAGNVSIRRLTQQGSNVWPVWTPDSTRVVFASDRTGTWDIYWRSASGVAAAERLLTGENGVELWPNAVSPDGRTLVFTRVAGPDAWSLWTLALNGEAEPEPLGGPRAAVEGFATFSPDGRALAFMAFGDDGVPNIVVEPFPAVGVRYPVTTTGAADPLWVRGRMFFARLGSTQRLFSMDITTGAGLTFGNERSVKGGAGVVSAVRREFDVFPDGERFVAAFVRDAAESEAAAPPRLRFVQNFFEVLERQVPVP